MADYRRIMQRYPRFASVIDFEAAGHGHSSADANEFETDQDGRGDSYRHAQQQPLVRLTGIRQLLSLGLNGPIPETPGPELRVLDVLGGDGTIARAVASICEVASNAGHWILTGDIAGHMTAEALRYRVPAICQPAQRLALHDNTFDAVILAYGTHHIPFAERKAAYSEAWRVLKPGGCIVVHDFEQGGQVARWFDEVVHRFTPGGHAYRHFTRSQLIRDLDAVGFEDASVEEMYDPFIVPGPNAESASDRLCAYVSQMYGLFGLRRRPGWRPELWRLMTEYMSYRDDPVAVVPEVTVIPQETSGHLAIMPRVALAGVAVKSHTP